MLVPAIGTCVMPLTLCGCGMPAASRMVGTTSITWWNWVRMPPRSAMPRGQDTAMPLRVPPKCDAICLVQR